MAKIKIKPPKETKAELMEQVFLVLQERWRDNPSAQIHYLLNFFHSADLAEILKELKR